MGIRINIGVTRKIGTPNYGSRGASANAEFELDGSLDNGGVQRFQEAAQRAYAACDAAVSAELAKADEDDAQSVESSSMDQGTSHGHQANGESQKANGRQSAQRSNGERLATASQVRAIHAIASRHKVDLAGLLTGRHEVNRPEELSIGDASALIDELKALNGEAADGQRGTTNVGRGR